MPRATPSVEEIALSTNGRSELIYLNKHKQKLTKYHTLWDADLDDYEMNFQHRWCYPLHRYFCRNRYINRKNDSTPPPISPLFFYWLSVDTKATSRILEKQEAKNRGTTTHTPWYNLDYAATPRKQVEPRKNNNNKLSFVGVRIVQAVNKSKKQIQAKKLLARGRKAA